MYLCTTRFNLEDKQATLLAEFFSRDEIEAAKKEKDEKPDEIELDPISDTEEHNPQPGNDKIELGPRHISLHKESDETTKPPLPSLERHTQLRALGRKRKNCEDNRFEYH
jgi:hypothetical protein